MGVPSLLSAHEQLSETQSSRTMAPVKAEAQTPLSNVVGSGSPGAVSAVSSQDQIFGEDSSISADPKDEDMDEVSRQTTPVPSQLNPVTCQDEDSQLSFNQESQSSETSVFSVRWPKVCNV